MKWEYMKICMIIEIDPLKNILRSITFNYNLQIIQQMNQSYQDYSYFYFIFTCGGQCKRPSCDASN